MGCPNCAAKLAELGPGWWAAFFIVGLFGMLGAFMLFVTKRGLGGTDADHVEVKFALLDCEDEDWRAEARAGTEEA